MLGRERTTLVITSPGCTETDTTSPPVRRCSSHANSTCNAGVTGCRGWQVWIEIMAPDQRAGGERGRGSSPLAGKWPAAFQQAGVLCPRPARTGSCCANTSKRRWLLYTNCPAAIISRPAPPPVPACCGCRLRANCTPGSKVGLLCSLSPGSEAWRPRAPPAPAARSADSGRRE